MPGAPGKASPEALTHTHSTWHSHSHSHRQAQTNTNTYIEPDSQPASVSDTHISQKVTSLCTAIATAPGGRAREVAGGGAPAVAAACTCDAAADAAAAIDSRDSFTGAHVMLGYAARVLSSVFHVWQVKISINRMEDCTRKSCANACGLLKNEDTHELG